jgi:HSP90 family molecular chaperone
MSRDETTEIALWRSHAPARAPSWNASRPARRKTQLIGQSGVGFYSAFMVAHRLDVIRWQAGGNEAELLYPLSPGASWPVLATYSV